MESRDRVSGRELNWMLPKTESDAMPMWHCDLWSRTSGSTSRKWCRAVIWF